MHGLSSHRLGDECQSLQLVLTIIEEHPMSLNIHSVFVSSALFSYVNAMLILLSFCKLGHSFLCVIVDVQFNAAVYCNNSARASNCSQMNVHNDTSLWNGVVLQSILFTYKKIVHDLELLPFLNARILTRISCFLKHAFAFLYNIQ